MRGIMATMEEIKEKDIVVIDDNRGVIAELPPMEMTGHDIILPAVGFDPVNDLASAVSVGGNLDLAEGSYVVLPEEQKIVEIGHTLTKAVEIIDHSVPEVKRGQMISFLDSEGGLQRVTGKIITFEKLPIPNDYVIMLIQAKKCYYAVVHKSDWLRMGDNIRQVENDAIEEVTAFLEHQKVTYLSLMSSSFGGINGFSGVYAANRLWKQITGRKLKTTDLII